MERLNAFDSQFIDDENNSQLQQFDWNSDKDYLDYIFLVLARVIGSDAAFKGGYLLSSILENDEVTKSFSRKTQDVDLSIMKIENYKRVKLVLKEIAENLLTRGLIESYKMKEDITATSSGGIVMYKNTGEKIGVDVGLHDITYGTQLYNLKVDGVNGFTIERMLSDKLTAILSRKRFRRTKDLYDFYVLTNLYDVDYLELKKFIQRRGNAEWDNIPFSDEALIQYEKAWEKLNLVNSKTGTALKKPRFDECIGRFNQFANLLKSNKTLQYWSHVNLQFH